MPFYNFPLYFMFSDIGTLIVTITWKVPRFLSNDRETTRFLLAFYVLDPQQIMATERYPLT